MPPKFISHEHSQEVVAAKVYKKQIRPKNKIENRLISCKEVPVEWLSAYSLSLEFGSGSKTIENKLNEIAEKLSQENNKDINEYRKFGRKNGRGGNDTNFYSNQVIEKYQESRKVQIPEDWLSTSFLTRELGGTLKTTEDKLNEIAEKLSQENNKDIDEYKKFGKKNSAPGRPTNFYSKEVVEKYQEFKKKQIPEEWLSSSSLVSEFRSAKKTIENKLNEIAEKLLQENNKDINEYRKFGKKNRSSGSKLTNFYSKEVVDKYRGIKESIPVDWVSVSSLKTELGGNLKTIENKLNEIAEKLSQENHKDINEYRKFGKKKGFSLNFYSKIVGDEYKKIVGEYKTKNNVKEIPDNWMSAEVARISFHFSGKEIAMKLAEKSKELAKENNKDVSDYMRFGKKNRGPYSTFYHEDVIKKYNQFILQENAKNSLLEQDKEKENKIKGECNVFLQNVIEGKSAEYEEFKKLFSVFGSARVVDLLYAFHPEFKKLPVEYLKSELAKYLGDYMVVRSGNVLGDAELALPYLGEKSFQESLFTVIKEDAVHYYQVEKKKHKEKEDTRILDEYITLLRDKAVLFHNDDFDDVVSQVESYIFSILNDFDKPDNVIDELNQGRTFPDLNQTINIKEIRDQRRVLIGDEMGMGKSASAILSKEYLGIGTALVVVPSNVIETWHRYLSDAIGEDGKQLGYFKQGQTPRVFEIGSIEDIAKIQSEKPDYVVISHEKFNDEYAKKLKDSPIEMVIIDEVHKFKNVKDGIRSQALLDLMQEFKERDAYTVLLSGTPVPNKIQDLAVTLKLLYPEEFGKMDNAVLVSSIIKGDNINLRDLLFKKTQMKKLAESVDMPEKVESDSFVEFSEQERELYELLLEDDELTATEKLMTLRQFCLNPRKIFPDIEIQSSKVREAKRAIKSHFETNTKLVFFVNGYIDGIIRGENSIIEQLQLPNDVTIKIIDGDVSKEERAEIEKDLKYMTHGKVLLVLSGMAADVGVDFSSAESVYFYNEPWTKFDKMQQQARVYRPGLTHDITVDTSLIEGSVEEGIHYYLEMKYKAVMKLLEGVPLSEIEQSMLLLNEKISNDKTIEGDQGLAEEWLQSPVNRLNRFFGATKEIGEEKMKGFLEKYGEEYAEYYADMGTRGFQSNTARFVTALIKQYQKEKGVEDKLTILDVASGPEMLRKRMNKDDAENLYSLDINKNHFTEQNWRQVVAGFTDTQFADNSVDYLNMSLAIHYSSFRPSRGEFERLQVFGEIARVLKVGGRSTINLVHSIEWKNKEALNNLLEELGLKVVENCTGLATSGSHFMSECLTFEKVEEVDLKEKMDMLQNGERELLNGLKIATKGKTKLRKSQEILRDFSINGKDIEADLNEEDTKLLIEQEHIQEEGDLLIKQYGSVQEIPREELLKRSILRYVSGSKYKLVKKSSYTKAFIHIN